MSNVANQDERRSAVGQAGEIRILGFMALAEIEDDIFRGGILVTDSSGKPIEFRCTSPIQPNNVQKTLYGQTLWPHIAVTLVGLPLCQGVTESLDVVIVNQSDFLEMRPETQKPLLLLTKQGEAMTLAEGGELKAVRELITSPSGKFEPVVATCHWEYGHDLHLIERLRTTCSAIDLLEPFERISSALKFVHEKGALTGSQ